MDGFGVTVTLEKSANEFNLKNGHNGVTYTVKNGDATIVAGAEVLNWIFDPKVAGKTASVTLNLSATSTDFKVAVEYADILTISCQESGGVLVDKQHQTGQFTVEVRRLGALSLSVNPDDGWILNQIIASSDAGIQISADGGITLESVHEDKELMISFHKLPAPIPI